MIKIGIIGYGTIAATYVKSLVCLNQEYRLVGVYDINHTKAKNELKNITRVFDSLDEMLNTNIECVIISTPIHTHYEIALQCLKANKDVILEKPSTLSLVELKKLFQIAHKHNVLIYTALHSSFAMDIEWYLHNQERLEANYRVDKIKCIESEFYDPYMDNGEIIKDRVSLCGSYIDSGVNILSVCNRLISLKGFVTVKHFISTDKNGVTYSSDTIYADNKIQIIMHTGWNKQLNQKQTILSFIDTEDQILLDHSNQCVKLLCEGEEKILYHETKGERLTNQYINVFQDFLKMKNLCIHETSVMRVHELLLENNWKR